MSAWIAIVAVGLVTFLLRASFIAFADPHRFPHVFRQALTFVPPAVLAAIVAPGVLMMDGDVSVGLANPRSIAGLVALAVAVMTRSAVACIVAGMGALWLLQWAIG